MAARSNPLRMKMLNFGYKLGFTPIYWDGSAEVLRISHSPIRATWMKIQLLLVLAYEVFLIHVAAKPVKDGNPLGQVQIIYLTLIWILMNSCFIVVIWVSDYVDLINKLNEHYSKTFNSRK